MLSFIILLRGMFLGACHSNKDMASMVGTQSLPRRSMRSLRGSLNDTTLWSGLSGARCDLADTGRVAVLWPQVDSHDLEATTMVGLSSQVQVVMWTGVGKP